MRDPKRSTSVRRRSVLKMGGFAGMTTLLAGCTSGNDQTTTQTTESGGGGGGGDETTADGADEGDGDGKNTLVVALPAEQSSMDPANQYTSYGAEWISTVYAPLLRSGYDWENEQVKHGVPELAESYEWKEEDGEHLVQFTLRDGVTLHNGDELNAELVKAEMDYWFEGNTQTGNNLSPFVERTSIDDDMTVNVHTGEEPFSTFHLAFSGAIANPYVREERSASDFATDASDGGSGPYQFVSYEQGSQIVVEAYDDYWRDDMPKFDRIEFNIIPEGSTRMAQLRNGQLDLDNFISNNNWVSLDEDGDLAKRQAPSSMWGCTIFNHEANEAFQDSRVRRALSMTIDRANYNQAVFNGLGTPVSLPSISGTWFEFQDINQRNFRDLERAQQLMNEAGYEDGFEMTLQAGSDNWHQTMAQVTASMFGELGVDVTIEPMEAQTMWTEIAQGNYTAAVSENLGPPDPDHFIYNYCHPDGPWTTITQGWEDNIASENEHVFDLLEEQRATTETEQRRDVVEEIYGILAEEMPYHFYVNGVNVAVHQPELQDYWLHPSDISGWALNDVSWSG